MKIKDIILDFTPLLDITLILLFFFILFSNVDIAESKARLDSQMESIQEQQKAVDDRMNQADAMFEEADALKAQSEADLAIIADASNRQLSNLEALITFNRGANIKLILSMNNGEANIKIFQGKDLIANASPHGDLAGIICAALKETGYTEEDTVLCEFVLDGSEAGTATAYREIKQNLLYVKGAYKYFYYSETDISMGEE